MMTHIFYIVLMYIIIILYVIDVHYNHAAFLS